MEVQPGVRVAKSGLMEAEMGTNSPVVSSKVRKPDKKL